MLIVGTGTKPRERLTVVLMRTLLDILRVREGRPLCDKKTRPMVVRNGRASSTSTIPTNTTEEGRSKGDTWLSGPRRRKGEIDITPGMTEG